VNTLRRFHTVLFLATLVVGAPALRAQQAKPAAAAKHSLWKVQSKQNAVFLLGSVHVLRKEDYPLPAPIEAAFSNASIAVFETDIEAMEDPQLAMQLMAKGRLPAGETLRSQLSPDVYADLSKHLQTAGLPAQIFDSLSPAMAALSLVAIELKKLDLDPEYGLDKHFFKLAKQGGKKIIPLETIDFQIKLFTEFTKEEGELLVKTTLRDIDTMQKDLGDLLKAWQTGDATKLEKLLNEAKQDAPVIYKRLLIDRNMNWLPKIEELTRGKENAIVIVGAGHLVGTNGIVELMRKKKYQVTQE
jgi:uncharacterized protein YbaP (TraB family)